MESQLIRYLEKYNSCFLGETIIYRSPPVRVTWDPVVGIGYDNWVGGIAYSIGARINVPKIHYNRFFRGSINFAPRAQFDSSRPNSAIISLGIGRYLGMGKIRPYFVPAVIWEYGGGGSFVTINTGLSFRRQIELEVGHWNNIMGLLGFGKFIWPASVSLHYYPDFWKKKK